MWWSAHFLNKSKGNDESRPLLPFRYYKYYPAVGRDSLSAIEHRQQQDAIKGEEQMSRKSSMMHLFFTFILFGFFYLVCCYTIPPQFDYDRINTIISFGDSYTTRYLDMDTLTYACRNCTSAGGPNWVVYLTDINQWISWDFAYNSAPVNNTLVHQAHTVIDLNMQVRELYPRLFVSPSKKTSDIIRDRYEHKQRTAQSTLVTLWVGINDIDLTYDWDHVDRLDSNIMQQYMSLVENLINKGEHQFMLINVPPIHRAPLWQNTTHEAQIHKRVSNFNDKITQMISNLKKEHRQALFFEYDAYRFFSTVLDHASRYNFTDIDTFCPDW
ncbi:hypothetical protein BD560DRAFT_380374 [Blakeslea trispora]|nr:hypothetical protein BD560DRAFT_380374 [Blakeslea trispora]